MKPSRITLAVALTACLAGVAMAAPIKKGKSRPARSNRTQINDLQRIDINNINMVVKNTGSFAYDTESGGAGLEFPKGTGKTAVFAAGLWMGALVNGGVRVSVSEYSDDYKPGGAVGGTPDNPDLPEHKVYKLNRVYLDAAGGIDAATRDAVLADYIAGAVPHGSCYQKSRTRLLRVTIVLALAADEDPQHAVAGERAPDGGLRHAGVEPAGLDLEPNRAQVAFDLAGVEQPQQRDVHVIEDEIVDEHRPAPELMGQPKWHHAPEHS